jgi:hypothetical protein
LEIDHVAAQQALRELSDPSVRLQLLVLPRWGWLPIDRHDVVPHLAIEIVGVLPHGADRLLVGPGGALDAVVTAARTIENPMQVAFHRFHRNGHEERRRHVDLVILTGGSNAESPFGGERESRSRNEEDETGAGEPRTLHAIDPMLELGGFRPRAARPMSRLRCRPAPVCRICRAAASRRASGAPP